jgi:hypothetical protein
MKFSLFTVTYAGLFYDGKALTIEQQILKPKILDLMALPLKQKGLLLHRLISQKQTGHASKQWPLMKELNWLPLKA